MQNNGKIEYYIKELEKKHELYLRIKVRPGAPKSEIKEIMEDETIKIDIAAPPVKGRANDELIRFLSKEFKIFKKNIKIIGGVGERIKLVKMIK